MQTDDLLREEIQRLYAFKSGLVAVFDVIDGRMDSRKAAVSLIMLIEAADRHLVDLGRICVEQGWSTDAEEPAAVRAWRAELETRVFDAPRGPWKDAVCLSLLRRAVHLKVPCYESARLFAFYSERPLIARTLRHALEDEQHSLERLRSASESGVGLCAAQGGGPLALG